MKNQFEILSYTPPHLLAKAIRTCWGSHALSDSEGDKIGDKDKSLIKRVGFQFKHASVLEHCRIRGQYRFDGDHDNEDFNIMDKLESVCKKYGYTYTEYDDSQDQIVSNMIFSYNLRAIIESEDLKDHLHLFIPEEYMEFLKEVLNKECSC